MRPSFFHSSLSLAFIICVLAVIGMIFAGVTPDDKLLTILASVISAYLASRVPKT